TSSLPGLALSGVSLDIILEPETKTLTVLVGEPATFRCNVTGGDLKNYQDPDPSVYQMRSPKTGRTVCLFTDFDSQADFQKPEGATVISLNSTVLDMKVMDSKSNGALTWNSETNIEFSTLNFKKIVFVSLFLLLDYSCDAKLIEKSFETDMDLNFYNLLVIGLRILLLKVIGFNLFMTLRLWSC
uniref:T-cell receptor alpha chain constant domain-containing protein n=1 Tax=Canis lupus familiaris TaxID=9615 RepID=A0A8C0NU70_CANLF